MTAILRLLVAIEAVGGLKEDGTPKYSSEDLQFFSNPADIVAALKRPQKPGAARTHYVAKLPMKDGTFDRHAVEETVRKNLEAIGPQTMHGVIYQEIVNATLEGRMAIERDIREKLSYKAGTSQRVIGDLVRGKLVESQPIVVAGQ